MDKRMMKIFYGFTALLGMALCAFAQESLQNSLKEEENYYNNFGVSGYSKKEIETKQKIPYYDFFGSHLVNGYLIYGLQTSRSNSFNSDNDAMGEKTDSAYSDMFQTSFVSENFNNLILVKDGLGDMKSVFLLGSQLQTRFSPLTMNKLNFQGVRWDVWTPTLKFTTLISRTRPFVMSMNDVSARAFIGYDREDIRNWQGVKAGELLPDENYLKEHVGAVSDDFPDRRDGWILNYDKWSDYSNKSIYGDYDILWGLHGNTNLANAVDLGFTYLNHHRSDIEKGEDIFGGNIPDEYFPSEIHFEFYDLTPDISTDAGAKIEDVTMTINGQSADLSTRDAYQVREDLSLVKSGLPAGGMVVSGTNKPFIVAFNTALAAKQLFGDTSKVRRIDFKFTVSGNYIVFVSTDKMVTLGYSGQRDKATNVVTYNGAFTRTIKGTEEACSQAGGNWEPFEELTGGTSAKPVDLERSVRLGNSWFGDYIARSPRIISEQQNVLDVYNRTRRTYDYSYSINSASSTYGIDLRGKVLGVKFNGEVAVNKKDYVFPGGDELDPVYRVGAYLRFDRDIVKNFLALSGMMYNIAPEYDPALESPMVSQHFSYSRLYDRYVSTETYGIPDYLWYPQHFNNNFHLLDDNDDNDLYVESDRIIYPSDLGSGNVLNRWYADGTFSSYKASTQGEDPTLHKKANYTYLPNGLYMFYGDDDGVYVDQFDRNHNSQVDYNEDFLLYYTDPPIFSLDNDMDNNGVWDVEDDDPYPDMPTGIKVAYVLTANGFKSLGIRGGNLKLVCTPVKTLELSTSVMYEKAIDLDFNRYSDENIDEPGFFGDGQVGYKDNAGNKRLVDEDFEDSRSLGVKLSGKLNVTKRSLGLEYFLGSELQFLRDNIRNDCIRLQEVEDIEYLYVDYYYQTDELRYRKAGIANFIGGLSYNNIPNFLYNLKLSLGLEKRFSLGEDKLFYTVRTLRSQAKDTTFYEFGYESYKAALLKQLYLVNKFDYTLSPDVSFKGALKTLNFINRFTVNPQYKFSWSYSSSDFSEDPRDSFDPSATLFDSDSLQLRLSWARYRRDNGNVFQSVPILRVFFKIAERTQFQYGVQWKRTYDDLIKSESGLRRVQTFQVHSTDNVAGYNVSLLMGLNFIQNNYDILNYDPLYENGHLYDGKDTRFFIRVYAGN